jgi:cell division protein FtsW
MSAKHTSTPSTGALAATAQKPVIPARILYPRLMLIVATVALLGLGLVMLCSASFVESFTDLGDKSSLYTFLRQLGWVAVGAVALGFAVGIDYRFWRAPWPWVSWVPLILVVVLLAITLKWGLTLNGATRWLPVFGFSFEPSEFAKIAMLLTAAMLFIRLVEGSDLKSFLLSLAAVITLPSILILLQPDLGTVIIAVVGVAAVAWFAGLPLKPFVITLALIILVGVGYIGFENLFNPDGFHMKRIDNWIDTWAWFRSGGDAELVHDGNRQIVNALYAFGEGGMSGVGLGMSHQKYLYLSESSNDMILPIIGEELGLFWVVVVVALFLLFLYAAYRIAKDAPDLHGRVIAGAAATMIGFQAFLNMLCTVNILPLTGKPLPFFSAGGSSIIATLILVGLILNVSLRSTTSAEATVRRNQLLIFEGGRHTNEPSASLSGLYPSPVSGFARASASVAKQPASRGRFRKPPVREPVAQSAKPAGSGQAVPLRKPPARKKPATTGPTPLHSARASDRPQTARRAADPALRMNPVRNALSSQARGAQPNQPSQPSQPRKPNQPSKLSKPKDRRR